jgi:hypothetical protein
MAKGDMYLICLDRCDMLCRLYAPHSTGIVIIRRNYEQCYSNCRSLDSRIHFGNEVRRFRHATGIISARIKEFQGRGDRWEHIFRAIRVIRLIRDSDNRDYQGYNPQQARTAQAVSADVFSFQGF